MNSSTRKQIKRNVHNIRMHDEQKIEILYQKAIVVLFAILWIVVICIFAMFKVKPTEMQPYIVPGYIERVDSGEYIVNVNEEIKTYETDRYFPIGQMVSVKMNTNGTKEKSDDFIEYIY